MKKPTKWQLLKRIWIGGWLISRVILGFYWFKLRGLWRGEEWRQEKAMGFYASQARRFRLAAAAMGGLLIKAGQMLSTRVDLLPKAVIAELSQLQDEVGAVPFADIQAVAEGEFGQPLDQIFASVEEVPLASASLGQVHTAYLLNGEKTAVKIQRPFIETIVNVDLRLLRYAMRMVKTFTNWYDVIDVERVYREIRQTVSRELDYLQEGRSAEQMAANFAGEPYLRMPAIYWPYTTRRVLTMEYMDGIKISDYEKLEKAALNRKQLAQSLLRIFIRQVLQDGFFHADPHPGNLMADRQGRIILLDFGMTGRITPRHRRVLENIVVAAVTSDYRQAVKGLKDLGVLLPHADSAVLADVLEMVSRRLQADASVWTDQGMEEFLKELERLLYEQPIQLPAEFTFLGRSVGALYGVCLGLCPQMHFIDELKTMYQELFSQGLWEKAVDKTTRILTAIGDMPLLGERVLRQAEQGELAVKLPMQQFDEHFRAVTQALYDLMWGIMATGGIIASAYLKVHGFKEEAGYGFTVTVLVMVYLLLFRCRRYQQKGRS